MLNDLRRRIDGESGFTLIEILVVILIIGILAAIAIPSFISQKGKASDAGAKSYARHLQTAQEAYFTDNSAYASSLSALQAIEPALNDTPSRTAPTATGDRVSFTVTATSANNVTFSIARDRTGAVSRTCNRAGVGGCSAATTW